MTAFLRQFSHLLFCKINVHIADAHRHLNLAVELFHLFHTSESRRHIIFTGFHAHYIYRELREALRSGVHHISCPASPDSRKTCSVSHIKHTAQLMLQLMTCPVSAVCSASGQAVMGQASCPHYLCPCLIVIRLCHKDSGIIHNGAQQMFADSVCQLHIAGLVEIPFHCMHHNIRASAGCLILRQSHGDLRIHNREFCPADIVITSPLQPSLLIGNYRRITHFGSCRGNRKNNSHRKTCFRFSYLLIKIPYVSLLLVSHTVSDSFGRIYYTAASYSQNKIHAFLPAQIYPLIDQGKSGVRHNSSQRHIRNARLVKRRINPVQKPGSLYTSASIVNKNLPASLLLYQVSGLLLCLFPKYNFRRCVISKILHNKLLLKQKSILNKCITATVYLAFLF